MDTERSELAFDDIQIYREKYIRELDKRTDKTEFALNNAESLYA